MGVFCVSLMRTLPSSSTPFTGLSTKGHMLYIHEFKLAVQSRQLIRATTSKPFIHGKAKPTQSIFQRGSVERMPVSSRRRGSLFDVYFRRDSDNIVGLSHRTASNSAGTSAGY